MKQLFLITAVLFAFAQQAHADYFSTDGIWQKQNNSSSSLIITTPGGWSQLIQRGVEHEITGRVMNNGFISKVVADIEVTWVAGTYQHPCVIYGCTVHLCASSEPGQSPYVSKCIYNLQMGTVVGQANKLYVRTSGMAYDSVTQAYDRWLRWSFFYTINGSGGGVGSTSYVTLKYPSFW